MPGMGSLSHALLNPGLRCPSQTCIHPTGLSLRRGNVQQKMIGHHHVLESVSWKQISEQGGEIQRGVRMEASASASGPSDDLVPGDKPKDSQGFISDTRNFFSAFWKFVRPHTIRGTVLGSTAVTARALLENSAAIDWTLLPTALLGVLALLCGNGFIVGINQIYDVDIDEVNKPFLPIAAKDLSPFLAWILVVGLAAGGIAVTALNFGPLITSLYSFGLFLGTIYSVPPLRLKRFAIPAFMIIAVVRGFLLNFGVYYATRTALGLPFQWSPAILFITVFVTIFATAIAITKDLADVKGDMQFQINTFATRLGVRNIALLGTGLLMLNYIGAVVLALNWPAFFNRNLMIGVHVVLALQLLYEGGKLDAGNYTQDAIRRYYACVWNLFYSEYMLLPFI